MRAKVCHLDTSLPTESYYAMMTVISFHNWLAILDSTPDKYFKETNYYHFIPAANPLQYPVFSFANAKPTCIHKPLKSCDSLLIVRLFLPLLLTDRRRSRLDTIATVASPSNPAFTNQASPPPAPTPSTAYSPAPQLCTASRALCSTRAITPLPRWLRVVSLQALSLLQRACSEAVIVRY